MTLKTFAGYLPDYVDGSDIETTDVIATSKVLSIAGVVVNVRTLSIVSCINLNIDMKLQADRSEGDHTMKWWGNAGQGGLYPSTRARDIAFSGNMEPKVAAEAYAKYLKERPRNCEVTCTMRGPDFDAVILRDFFDYVGLYYPQKPSLLDSHRTAMRFNDIFQLPELTKAELDRLGEQGPLAVPHVAIHDAGREAYETARAYHYAWHLIHNGKAFCDEMVKGWADGTIIEIPEKTDEK